MPKLENWSIHIAEDSLYFKAESKIIRLHGEIYGDDNFCDGTKITTSNIKNLDIENGIVETRLGVYKLGNKLNKKENVQYAEIREMVS